MLKLLLFERHRFVFAGDRTVAVDEEGCGVAGAFDGEFVVVDGVIGFVGHAGESEGRFAAGFDFDGHLGFGIYISALNRFAAAADEQTPDTNHQHKTNPAKHREIH